MASRPNRINIDLGPYKAAWLAHCKAHGVTSNQAFRQVVAKLTMRDKIAARQEMDIGQGPKVRRIIRLTIQERDYVAACATQQGFTANRWIVSLIRARMAQSPQLGAPEMAMLGRSNLILLGIARQLNRLSAPGPMADSGRGAELVTLLQALHIQFSSHVQEVGQVLARNVARWR